MAVIAEEFPFPCADGSRTIARTIREWPPDNIAPTVRFVLLMVFDSLDASFVRGFLLELATLSLLPFLLSFPYLHLIGSRLGARFKTTIRINHLDKHTISLN